MVIVTAHLHGIKCLDGFALGRANAFYFSLVSLLVSKICEGGQGPYLVHYFLFAGLRTQHRLEYY